jgi:hypothetical protein
MNKMNEYRVIVETSVAIGYANSTEDVLVVNALTPMDAHKQVHDKLNWSIQVVSEIYLNHNNELVYDAQNGFIE